MMKTWLSLVFLLVIVCTSAGQTKYWIFFKGKSESGTFHVSERTIENRQLLGLELQQYTDLSVDRLFLESLQQEEDVQPIIQSRWLNAVSAKLEESQLERVREYPFVEAIVPITARLHVTSNREDLEIEEALAYKQLNADIFTEENLNGEGVVIGVIDGGFKGAQKNKALKHIIDDGRVLGMRDFVEPNNPSLFIPKKYEFSGHGTNVFQMMAGLDDKNDVRFGLATEASYYLARTDHAELEFRGEEDYWIAALEWMDSLGVRLVNSSLGYSYEFDDPGEDYKPDQMNGQFSAIARAANIAVKEKGMILVTSAGNEGDDPNWQVVSTPGDAEHIITVGAANEQYWYKPEFSGVGPEDLSYIKPNITCATTGGTSYSAPFITGLIAAMLQKKPDLQANEVKTILEKSSHLYFNPNNYLGYGVPSCEKILAFLNDANYTLPPLNEQRVTNNDYPIDLRLFNAEFATVFFKKDERHVFRQNVVISKPYTIERPDGAERMTLIIDNNEVIEVIWEQ